MKGAVTLLLFSIVALSQLYPSTAFIRASGTRFVDETCEDFSFVGANSWRLLESQAGITGEQREGMTAAEWMFKTAAENNITVIRMFAAGVNEDLPLQIEDGEYNQEALVALDETLDLAAKYGVMVTLVLARIWEGPDALSNYASWTGTPIGNFFSDDEAIEAFKEHMTFMANRVNTVNEKVYRNDATIFSWNLMNEPRFFGNDTQCSDSPDACADTMNNWIRTTSDHLKSEDPNHMIAIGSEGFFGTGSEYQDANPEGDWAVETGQAFERNTANPSIDYAVAHLWIDNWDVAGNEEFVNRWIDAHKKASDDLNKPFHLEEFGKNTTNPFGDESDGEESIRRETFQLIFDDLEQSLENGESLRAASYWMWDPNLQSAESDGFEDYGQDQVPVDSSIFQEIIAPAAKTASEVEGFVEGCEPGLTSSISAPAEEGAAPERGA
jgi:mannan endo-1,4-beta-mannosidase